MPFVSIRSTGPGVDAAGMESLNRSPPLSIWPRPLAAWIVVSTLENFSAASKRDGPRRQYEPERVARREAAVDVD